MKLPNCCWLAADYPGNGIASEAARNTAKTICTLRGSYYLEYTQGRDMTLYLDLGGTLPTAADITMLKEALCIAEALLKERPASDAHLLQFGNRLEISWLDGDEPMRIWFTSSTSTDSPSSK